MSVVTKNPFELLGEAEDAPTSNTRSVPKGKKTITIEKSTQAPSAYGTYSKENTKHNHGKQTSVPSKTGYANPNKRVYDKKSGSGRSQGKQGGTGKGKWDPTTEQRAEGSEERPETPQPTTDAPEEVEEDTGVTLFDYKKNLDAPVAPREARKPQADSKKWDDVVRIEKPAEETKKTGEAKKEEKEKKSKFVSVNPTDLIQIAPKQDKPRGERREPRNNQNRDDRERREPRNNQNRDDRERREPRNNQNRDDRERREPRNNQNRDDRERRNNQGGNNRGNNNQGGNNRGNNNQGGNNRGNNNQGGNNRGNNSQGGNNRGNNSQNNSGKQGKVLNLGEFPELQ